MLLILAEIIVVTLTGDNGLLKKLSTAKKKRRIFSSRKNKSRSGFVSCKIWNDKKLVHNFIPCYRYSDEKPGLFDTVEGKFYTNQANGDDFTVGSEV